MTDFQGRAIRLAPERRDHMLKHPEMVDQMARIAETLAKPETVISTEADASVHVYHRLYERTPVTRKYLLVAVKLLDDDAFVLTAFFSNRLKKGNTVWPM